MNYEELKKYVNEMNESIVNKLKDSDEELAFYTELVKKFNSVCKDYYKLKQALDEIEIKLQNETILVDDEIERLLQIIIKAKGE